MHFLDGVLQWGNQQPHNTTISTSLQYVGVASADSVVKYLNVARRCHSIVSKAVLTVKDSTQDAAKSVRGES